MNSVRYTGVPRSLCGAPFKAAAVNSKSAILIFSVLLFGALFGFCQTVRAEPGKSPGNFYADSEYSALLDFVQLIGVDNAKLTLVSNKESTRPHSQIDDEAYSALREFAQRVGAGQPEPVKAPEQKFAEADNAFDALREFLQKGAAQPQATPNETPAAAMAAPKPDAIDATYVGEKVCMTCHGPGSAHVKAGGGRGVGGIISFRPDDQSRTAEENNATCLGCHQKGERTQWHGSTHQERGLQCTNCHTVMKNVSRKHQLKTQVEAETCYQCHKLQRAQMQYSSHMPVREGKVTCTNCHNPHGSTTEKLIREASVNENCYKCHAEKRGPLLWEHAPVREDCLNCHNPHGSNYEYLLKVARPRLCHECHSMSHSPGATGGFGLPNTPYVLGRACGNCHSNIHGSNHPNGMFFLR